MHTQIYTHSLQYMATTPLARFMLIFYTLRNSDISLHPSVSIVLIVMVMSGSYEMKVDCFEHMKLLRFLHL